MSGAPKSILKRVQTLNARARQTARLRQAIASAIPVEEAPAFLPESSGRREATLDRYLRAMVQKGCSDLHFCVSVPPMVRKDGEMVPLEGEEPVAPERAENMLREIMPPRNRDEFERIADTDFAYELPGAGRFRVNVYMDMRGWGGVFRLIPEKIPTAQQIGLPDCVIKLCSVPKGLVLVTGPTGSGKSTTLAAMIDHINRTRAEHIITIEDPIEFTHPNQKCLVNQREVHRHTESFAKALRAALREDPNIVLVGEMRDLETSRCAIETAETGHLVFATLHTSTASSTVDRIINQFPADEQEQIRIMLAGSLKGVVSQTLLRKKSGGRVAAREIMIVTPAVASNLREGKTHQLPTVIQTSRAQGSILLNDSLLELVKAGQVDPNEAYRKAIDKEDLGKRMAMQGVNFDPAKAQ